MVRAPASIAGTVVLAGLLAGCAAPYLSRIETEGVAPAKVEEDKLACSHQAQERMTWRQLGVGVAFGRAGSVMYEARSEELREKQRRIERTGQSASDPAIEHRTRVTRRHCQWRSVFHKLQRDLELE